jgi:hypothetical protein
MLSCYFPTTFGVPISCKFEVNLMSCSTIFDLLSYVLFSWKVRKKGLHSLLQNWMGSYLKHNFKV